MKKLLLGLVLVLLAGCAYAPAVPDQLPDSCKIRVSGSNLEFERAGFVQSFRGLEGVRSIEDEFGVDWAVIEECNAVALYTMQRGRVESYLIFAPEGFPLKEVFEEPWMGAKEVVIMSDPGRRLIIQAGGEQISS